MENMELGWVAGLLEGEGSFLTKRGNYALVQCAMTDQDTLERLKSLCGGSLCESKYKAKEHYKTVWVWQLQGEKAESLMRLVKPLMSARRTQKIEEVLRLTKEHQTDRLVEQETRKQRNLEIGRAYLAGEGTMRELALKFEVSQVTVKNCADALRVP